MPIVTQRARIPWSWAIVMGFPWIASVLSDRISAEPLTFVLRGFTDDPGTIAFILSFNLLFNFLVGVIASYLSDRIWTRMGRRKPFLISGWVGSAAALAFVPLMPNLWSAVIAIIAFQFFLDLARPWETLFNEVIPPKQRGRAGVFRLLQVNAGVLLMGTVLLKQYDKVYSFSVFGMQLTGDKVVFWTVALVLLAAAALMYFFVREEKPISEIEVLSDQPKMSVLQHIKKAARDIFGERQARWVYLLYTCPVIGTSAASASFIVLFQTEQMGFSKEQLADINLYTLPAMMLAFTPLAGYLADKINRLTMMRIGVLVPALIWLGYVGYARFVADYSISITTMVVFGLFINFFQSWLWQVWGPLIYDYIPSNRMGTYAAGITTVSGVMAFLLSNVGGQWIKGWTRFFGSPTETEYDYSSVVVAMVLFSLLAVGATYLFAWAERRGYVKPLGREERRVETEPEPAG